MIANGKTVSYYFLQIVWKCTDFRTYAFKICQKCKNEEKNFIKISMGFQKTQNFMLIPNSLIRVKKKVHEKNYGQKSKRILGFFGFCSFYNVLKIEGPYCVCARVKLIFLLAQQSKKGST